MEQIFTYPDRRTLIIGAILVALYGVEQECILRVRLKAQGDWSEDPDFLATRALIDDVKAGKMVHTQDRSLLGLLAHTQQTLRVSHEEWDAVCPIQKAPEPNA